ncbi:hypothetical protein A4D02_35840 [Niastella koreensis]|uniref:Rad50/SbcC-type AAA domain-containing protein n=2 Tax=Niastella koreensis TaxID=354356 RepID=G8T907_NIAKG|nr:hypothetical protein [Niastella koreensis]AEW02364.1 hypothetical protein Niako_6139 [Niastella koreensis GR20-10]OQP43417.1 hypothetical protein A4D02_35840 [Niastella koreensis]
MNTHLKYQSLLAYSDKLSKCFFTHFGDGVNIVHGRNTSGKSTLFLSLLYTFGINDGNNYLADILKEKTIFRLDCILRRENIDEKLIIIRDDDTIYIKVGAGLIKRFSGINGNRAVEHTKVKTFISELFEFNLLLESKNEYKPASIETIFLPYYISQSVGWVYLRKSFSGLEFYKNFKEDYLDFYLGLESSTERVKRHELEAKLKTKLSEISSLEKLATKNDDIQLTKWSDEKFIDDSKNYIQDYAKNYDALTQEENEYVLKCNELGFLLERKKVLLRVSRNQKEQKPEIGVCPTCTQSLPLGISEAYKFFQEENDTNSELEIVKEKIRDIQSKINSLQISIKVKRDNISKDYSTLNKYVHNEVTFEKWLKNKANTELLANLSNKIGELTLNASEIKEDLKKYKSDQEIAKTRVAQTNVFSTIFQQYLSQLGIKKLIEDRHTKIYEINTFPSQGVELHKTVMAYHFAFNRVISDTADIHRLPFMLDAIFKEDLDEENRSVILDFISKNKPKDTQTILSIAQTKNQKSNAAKYNKDHFQNNAKLIQIGDGISERCFLNDDVKKYDDIINDTNELMLSSN